MSTRNEYRARFAEPISIEEVFGGRYDGSFRVKANCPHCGESVVHLMEHEDGYGPAHRVCNHLCGGDYELVRPSPVGLLDGPSEDRWWEPRAPRFGGLASLGGFVGVEGFDVPSAGPLLSMEGV